MNETEKAIQAITAALDAEPDYAYCGESFHLIIDRATQAALDTLREKAERSKRCEYCDDNFKFWQTQISGEFPNVRYCPMCGRRLEVEHEN